MSKRMASAIALALAISPIAMGEESVVLYGGLSYIDETTTPAMARMLSNDASGVMLREGNDLIDFASQKIERLNASSGLPNVTRFSLVQTNEGGWDVAGRLGADQTAGQLIQSLQLYGAKVYGLLLLANYEDVIPQTLSYTDATTRTRKEAKKRTYVASVSALLLELDSDTPTRRIVLSSSDLGLFEYTSDVDFEPTDAQKAQLFSEAYERAITGALSKLADAKFAENGSLSHIVTGFAMSDEAPADLLNYDLSQKPTVEDLSSDLCMIPDGCTSAICEKRAAMLMHGLTSSLSEAGFPVLPPITAEYAGDIANGIELNLSLFSDDAQLLGGVQSILVDPSDAATKWVVVWRGSQAIDQPSLSYPDEITDRIYVSRVGYIRGRTGFGTCSEVSDLARDPVPSRSGGISRRIDGNAMGCSVENYVNSLGPPGRGVERDHYTLAALDHVGKIGQQLKGERVSDDILCEPFAGAD